MNDPGGTAHARVVQSREFRLCGRIAGPPIQIDDPQTSMSQSRHRKVPLDVLSFCSILRTAIPEMLY